MTLCLISEMESLIRAKDPTVIQGPTTEDAIGKFSLSSLALQMRREAPHLYDLLIAVILPPLRYDTSNEPTNTIKDAEKGATLSLSMLLKHRSNKAMAIPLMMTMMMIGRGTNRQVHAHSLLVVKNHNQKNFCQGDT